MSFFQIDTNLLLFIIIPPRAALLGKSRRLGFRIYASPALYQVAGFWSTQAQLLGFSWTLGSNRNRIGHLVEAVGFNFKVARHLDKIMDEVIIQIEA